MNICLVGGIFDRPEAVRSKQLVTPETVLLDGFREIVWIIDDVAYAQNGKRRDRAAHRQKRPCNEFLFHTASKSQSDIRCGS